MTQQTRADYKLDKCLEKLHEIHISQTQQQGVSELQSQRLNSAESRIKLLEGRLMKLTILVIVSLSGGAAVSGPEILNYLRALL